MTQGTTCMTNLFVSLEASKILDRVGEIAGCKSLAVPKSCLNSIMNTILFYLPYYWQFIQVQWWIRTNGILMN